MSRFFSIAALLILTAAGCEFRSAEKPAAVPVTTVAPVTGLESVAGQAVARPDAADLRLDDTPLGKEWSAIWELSDPYPALKEFVAKHGLFLETAEKVGEFSVRASEGPCGDEYVSLVKDTSRVIEHAWEIDASGKVLREWRTGNNEILRVDKNRLLRVIDLHRKISDFNTLNPQRDATYASFVLSIGDDGRFELLSDDADRARGWKVTEEPCPKDLKIESDYKYCVREKSTGRRFVLQRECT